MRQKKVYYITWDEKKHGREFGYILCVFGWSAKQAREEFYWNEQNYRTVNKLPHMFHFNVTDKIPSDENRSRGHLYY